MTDPLTDAVRRLKQLQQDVERLQSAENEEGEVRLFFTQQEQAVGDDALDVSRTDKIQAETATATDSQGDLRRQRRVGQNKNHFQWTTSTWNTSTWNGVINRPEVVGYDLATSGSVVVSLRDVGDATAFGVSLEATAPATFVIESVPDRTVPFQIATFTNRIEISTGFNAPEATAIRVRNTTAAAGTADAVINRSADKIPTRNENANYDLSTTGPIVAVRDENASSYGFSINATTPATFVVERVGDVRGVYETETFPRATTISSGFDAPEADTVRIRNTSISAGTADVVLNSS
jgi:hypothetical protein